MYSLIIVDYNQMLETVKYIERCRQFLKPFSEVKIVVVENGEVSNINLLKEISTNFDLIECKGISQSLYRFILKDELEIIYCNSGTNMGYAKGNNLGIRIANSLWDIKYHIVSNNDIEFKKVFDLQIVTDLFESNSAIGVIGPNVITPQGEKQSPRKWEKPTIKLILTYWIKPLGKLIPFIKNTKSYIENFQELTINTTTGPVPWLSGCFMILDENSGATINYFDENTFLYAEEMILSRKLEGIGKQTWYCDDLEIVHNHAQTTKKFSSSLFIKKINFESLYYYYKTYEKVNKCVLFISKINFSIVYLISLLFEKIMKNKGK